MKRIDKLNRIFARFKEDFSEEYKALIAQQKNATNPEIDYDAWKWHEISLKIKGLSVNISDYSEDYEKQEKNGFVF